jgi:hypothetical protein
MYKTKKKSGTLFICDPKHLKRHHDDLKMFFSIKTLKDMAENIVCGLETIDNFTG